MFIDLIHKTIIDNFAWQMIDPRNRQNIINFLNNKFFPDNISKFVDITTDLDIDINTIGVHVRYKNNLYNLTDFDKYYKRIERIRKLNKIKNEYR